MILATIPRVTSSGTGTTSAFAGPIDRTLVVSITNLFEFLAGTWRLEREITDQRGDRLAQFKGCGDFVATGERQLLYLEQGALDLGYGPLEARRALSYAFATARWATVRFADGSLFHYLDLSEGESRVHVTCGEDAYVGSFAALGSGDLSVRWQADGPRKCYESKSLYRRLSSYAEAPS